MINTPRSGIPIPVATDPYRLIDDLTGAFMVVDGLTYPVAKPTLRMGAALLPGAIPTITLVAGSPPDAPVYELRMPRGDVISTVEVVGRAFKITTTGGVTTTTGNVLPRLSIGTVTTGAAGSGASASWSGTDLDPKLNLSVPRGDKGDMGLAGMTMWVDSSGVPQMDETPIMLSGTGSPEGVVTAGPGTRYIDRNTPADTWYKATGTGATGWVRQEVALPSTGWRRISGTAITDAKGNTFSTDCYGGGLDICRIGTVVYLRFGFVLTKNVKAPYGPYGTIPYGFQADNPCKAYTAAQDQTPTPLQIEWGGGAFYLWGVTESATRVVLGACQWPTRDPWPTTLPGVAI